MVGVCYSSNTTKKNILQEQLRELATLAKCRECIQTKPTNLTQIRAGLLKTYAGSIKTGGCLLEHYDCALRCSNRASTTTRRDTPTECIEMTSWLHDIVDHLWIYSSNSLGRLQDTCIITLGRCIFSRIIVIVTDLFNVLKHTSWLNKQMVHFRIIYVLHILKLWLMIQWCVHTFKAAAGKGWTLVARSRLGTSWQLNGWKGKMEADVAVKNIHLWWVRRWKSYILSWKLEHVFSLCFVFPWVINFMSNTTHMS